MSADPSSFNFDTGLSNIGLDTSGSGSSGFNTSGLTESNILGLNGSGGSGGGSSSSSMSGMPTVPNLNPVNVSANTGTVDLSTLGNPFAGANGGAPLTASNFSPSMSNVGFDPTNLTNSLGTELGLSGGVSTGGSAGGGSSGGGGASSLFGGNFLSDAALAGLGYYGMSQAQAAQAQTNAEIAPLQSESQSMLGQSKSLLAQYNSGTLPSWAQPYVNTENQTAASLMSNYNAGQLPAGEQQYANQLNSVGSNLIQQYQSGTLPSWAQNYVDWTSQQATNLIAAQPTQALETLATQNFTDYTSGKLKPADEISLNQQTQAQKARVQQLYASSGDANSTAMEAQFQQIDNQAAVTRQNILNSYFQTGDTAYNSWLTANAQGAQVKAQGAQFANTVFSTMLSQGLSAVSTAAQYTQTGLNQELSASTQLTETAAGYTGTVMNNVLTGAEQTASVGDQALTQAIGIQLQSDNQLSQMVGSLMQSIAATYAYSAYRPGTAGAAGGAGGTAGGGSSGSNGTISLISNIVGGVEQYGSTVAKGISGLFSGAGGQAAASGATSASGASAASGAMSDVGTALGAVGAAYSAYNTINNWQSGNTGADALNAAETGASIGAMFGPVGFVVGGVIGGAVGALSSAFGGGKNDPETLNWDNLAPQINANPQIVNSMSPSQAFQSIAGLMDAKNNSPGHSSNLELKFGRMGENAVMTDMATWINQAISSGQVPAGSSPGYLYCSVVMPKLKQMGAYVPSNAVVTKNGTQAGSSVDALLTRLVGLWQSGNLSSSTPVGVNGQTISGLPQYG